MAKIIVETTQAEQDAVLAVIKDLRGETTPVATIASLAGIKASRTRYILLDLIEAGKIERVPTKAFNKHYIRYGYRIR